MNVRLELSGGDLGGLARAVVERLAAFAGASEERGAALGHATAAAVGLARPGNRVVLEARWESAADSEVVVAVRGIAPVRDRLPTGIDEVRLLPDGVELRQAVVPRSP